MAILAIIPSTKSFATEAALGRDWATGWITLFLLGYSRRRWREPLRPVWRRWTTQEALDRPRHYTEFRPYRHCGVAARASPFGSILEIYSGEWSAGRSGGPPKLPLWTAGL